MFYMHFRQIGKHEQEYLYYTFSCNVINIIISHNILEKKNIKISLGDVIAKTSTKWPSVMMAMVILTSDIDNRWKLDQKDEICDECTDDLWNSRKYH